LPAEETVNMMRNMNTLFLHQVFAAFFWVLTLVSVGFIITWVLVYMREPRDGGRPGFNLKEI
jgi:hypothetical protein